MSGPTIDGDVCVRRLKRLYASWEEKKDALWGGATAFLIGTGQNKDDDLRYLKSASVEVWLFGYELSDTLLLFIKGEMHVVTGGKKATLLGAIADQCEKEAGVKFVIHNKPKGEDGAAQVDEVLKVCESQTVGMVTREAEEGALMKRASSSLKSKGTTIAEVGPGLAETLAVKEDSEMAAMRKAVHLTTKAMEWAIDQLEEVINEEKRISHAKLSEQTEDAIVEPSKIKGVGKDITADDVDICYPPIFQSGGDFDLRYSAESTDKKLHHGVIHVSLGARYQQYCANVGRTLMIDPTKEQEATYSAALAAQEAAIAALVDGADLSAPYAAAKASLASAPEVGGEALAAKLTKNVGSAMGLELREGALTLIAAPKYAADAKVRAGMVFNIAVGLSGLENAAAKEGSKDRKYAIMIADTVMVSEEGKAPVTLTSNTKARSDISYNINEDGDDEDEEADDDDKDDVVKAAPRVKGGVVKDAKTRAEETGPQAEELRRAKQEALADKKNQETYARLTKAQNAEMEGKGSGQSADFMSYKNVADVPVPPRAGQELVLTVDRNRESLLLPVHGCLVPFHIMAVKSISVTQDAGHSFIRVNFNTPVGPNASANAAYLPAVRFPDATFLRELSYRSTDSRHANHVVQEVKALKRAVVQRETEKAERATLVKQERLQMSAGRVHRIVGVWMLPTFGGRGGRKAGTLEAHVNGFRYVGAKADETLDVMYANIRFAFFQPAKKDIKTLIHFHLHNPIMVGKKKTKDVQFYMEVMEAVQSLDGGRRNMYDPDEIEEEQRDREREKRIQKEFQAFCKRVQDVWERDFPKLGLEFDVPYHDLAFDGVPFKSTVRILPTAHCLVELTEFPAFVVSAEDIEVVNLERVGFHLKNFDMAIIFKDFTRDVHRIDQIPVQNLDNIKQWLSTLEIKYYEGKSNLNWKPLLKSIRDDPDGWLEAGGWEFLNNEASDEEEVGEEGEESDAYEPSEDEDEEEESDEDMSDDDESVVDSEDDDEDEDFDEEDEEGLSWDELEEQAMEEDRNASESESDRKSKKRKGGGGGGGGGKDGGGKRSRR